MFLQSLPISISHAEGLAFCAVIGGCDVERVEPRSPLFVEDYFTQQEIRQVKAAEPESRDTLVTTIWSAKESALKVFRLGLSVDTRWVSCTVAPAKDDGGWGRVDIQIDERLGRGPLSAWWRPMGDYVLTVAAQSAS